MLMVKNDPLQARMAELQREMDALKTQIESPVPPAAPARTPPMRKANATAQSRTNRSTKQHRLGRVTIAPGIMLTTLVGSLYTTICKVLASLGHLSEHDGLFAEFMRRRTADAAKKLIAAISVSRADLEQYVRADEEFHEHCERRTLAYKNKAAVGSVRHQRILQNPSICHGGNWSGDISEAISILSGARKPAQVRRGKNVQILNQASLMFDTTMVGGVQVCVLYKRKWHHAYTKAAELVKAASAS